MIELLFYNFPENLPLYKDSGNWQMRSDDMKLIIAEQKMNESFKDFIIRCKSINNTTNIK